MTASSAVAGIQDASSYGSSSYGSSSYGSSSYGSFTFEVLLEAPVGEVWQAFVQAEQRTSWLRLPGRPGPQTAVDLQPGASETLHAQASLGDTIENLRRDTHVVDLVTERRLVFVHRVIVNDQPRWASLTTVHLDPHPGQDGEPDLARLMGVTGSE